MHMEQLDVYCSHCGASNQKEDEQCFACGHLLALPEDLPGPLLVEGAILQKRYRLIKRVGAGGFSVVFQAEDLQTKQRLALKTVSLRGLTTAEKIEATDAFNREVTTLSKLTHRNLPRLHQHFADSECWYIVMDYIEGETLETYLGHQPITGLPLSEVLDLAQVLCAVLAYLHTHEPAIIFRDLKPSNVMLTTQGQIFLIDFGIARQFKAGKQKDTIPFGSPGYAAPEQYGKAQTTPRSDIYSLGAILHQLLTKNDPSLSPFAFTPLPDLHHPVQARLNTLIQQMTALNSEHRPDSIQEVQKSLHEVSQLHYQRPGIYSASYQPSFYPTINSAPITAGVLPGYPPPAPYGGGIAYYQQQQMYPGAHPPPYIYPPPNSMAFLSIILNITGINISLVFNGINLIITDENISWLLLRHIVALLLPTMVVIFGHKGRRFALRHKTKTSTATLGLVLGYGSMILYFAIYIATLLIKHHIGVY